MWLRVCGWSNEFNIAIDVPRDLVDKFLNEFGDHFAMKYPFADPPCPDVPKIPAGISWSAGDWRLYYSFRPEREKEVAEFLQDFCTKHQISLDNMYYKTDQG